MSKNYYQKFLSLFLLTLIAFSHVNFNFLLADQPQQTEFQEKESELQILEKKDLPKVEIKRWSTGVNAKYKRGDTVILDGVEKTVLKNFTTNGTNKRWNDNTLLVENTTPEKIKKKRNKTEKVFLKNLDTIKDEILKNSTVGTYGEYKIPYTEDEPLVLTKNNIVFYAFSKGTNIVLQSEKFSTILFQTEVLEAEPELNTKGWVYKVSFKTTNKEWAQIISLQTIASEGICKGFGKKCTKAFSALKKFGWVAYVIGVGYEIYDWTYATHYANVKQYRNSSCYGNVKNTYDWYLVSDYKTGYFKTTYWYFDAYYPPC